MAINSIIEFENLEEEQPDSKYQRLKIRETEDE
jgi:hypothetical protein